MSETFNGFIQNTQSHEKSEPSNLENIDGAFENLAEGEKVSEADKEMIRSVENKKRILIISLNDVQVPLIYPEGPLYIGKQIEEGHKIGLLSSEFYDELKDLEGDILKFNPDFVMCSIRNGMNLNKRAKIVIDFLRDKQISFVVGGAALTVFKEHATNYLGLSKSESFFGEFESKISSLFPELEDVVDVKEMKMPDTSFMQYEYADKLLNEKRVFGIEVRRGCPFNCIYCSYPELGGFKFRMKNIETIINNIDSLYKKGIKKFFFTDAIFNIPKNYTLELCKEIDKIFSDVEFGAFINPKNISDEEAKLWRKINLTVELGVDGLSEKSLKAWDKPFSIEDVKNSIEVLKRNGVNFNVYLMFGCPGQTVEDIKQELELLEELNPPVAEITVAPTIYPETELHKHAIRDGIVSPDEPLIPTKTYIPPSIDQRELMHLLDGKKREYERRGWGIIYNQYQSNPTLERYSE